MDKLPEEFLNRMKKILNSDEYNKYLLSLNEPIKRGLVFNSVKMDRQTFLDNVDLNLKELPFNSDCFLLTDEQKVGGNAFHIGGAFYMQEPSAMLAGLLLPIKSGDVVLDACASPGGKTFQLSKRIKQGSLVANEIDFSRAKILESNLERLGVNAIITNCSSEELSEIYKNTFDAILVDSPCSGEGMFRKEEQAITRWSEEYVNVCAKRSFEILTNIDKTLKAGGYLMYSTCTFSLEENEYVVKKLVDIGYEIIELPKIEGAVDGVKIEGYHTEYGKRFYPHLQLGEGQFICLLKKLSENPFSYKPKKLKDKLTATEEKLVFDFHKKNMINGEFEKIKEQLIKRNDCVFVCPNINLMQDNKKIFGLGRFIGEIRKNRFEPQHNIFINYSASFINKLELNKTELDEYLKGNTLQVELSNGYCAVYYCGCPIGGGKVVDGILKNHYPKGLRTK